MSDNLSQKPSIPRGIWALGTVSLLMKTSSVIVFSLSPLFVTQVLGASTIAVGLLEGFIEAFSLFTRIFAGILSDFLHKRKSIIVIGYVFALISRPLLGLASSIAGVFLGRAFDRIGNGLDATPRDALVGDLAPKSIKGACYGLRESMARAGSFSGSLLAIGLLWYTQNNYSLVFWLGSIPTALALLVLIIFVSDPAPPKEKRIKKEKPFKLEDVLKLKPAFWLVLLLSGTFTISNFSGAFLILRAEDSGLTSYLLPLVMVIQNIATTATAYPVGYLSDIFGRRSMMAIGIVLVIIADLFLATNGSVYLILVGVLIWGAEMGITISMLSTLLADTCPHETRGTGFGLLQLTNGLSFIIANALAGWLWHTYNPSTMFYTSACIAAMSALVLPFIHSNPLKEEALT